MDTRQRWDRPGRLSLLPTVAMHNTSALEFADQKSIFSAVAKVDTYDLAKVIASLDSEALKQKFLAALSRSRREEVESDLKDMPAVDPIEVQQIGNSIVNTVKELMTGGRG